MAKCHKMYKVLEYTTSPPLFISLVYGNSF